jgi:ribosomal RNA assembly protein
MPQEEILVPKSRVAVVIGTKGKTKRDIESATGAKLKINSATGQVIAESDDAVKAHRAITIVRAIARGFSPEKALLLANDDYYLSVIDLHEFVGKSSRAVAQKKARLIGTHGNVRKTIEEKTNCFISVFGDTVAIIGRADELEVAERAVEMLAEGASIPSVYRAITRMQEKMSGFEL